MSSKKDDYSSVIAKLAFYDRCLKVSGSLLIPEAEGDKSFRDELDTKVRSLIRQEIESSFGRSPQTCNGETNGQSDFSRDQIEALQLLSNSVIAKSKTTRMSYVPNAQPPAVSLEEQPSPPEFNDLAPPVDPRVLLKRVGYDPKAPVEERKLKVKEAQKLANRGRPRKTQSELINGIKIS